MVLTYFLLHNFHIQNAQQTDFYEVFHDEKQLYPVQTTIDASLLSTDTHTTVGKIFITEGHRPALSIKNNPVREIRHLCDNRHIYSNIQQMATLIISAPSRNRTAVALPIVQLL